MIDHLKKEHRILYLPPPTDTVDLSYKITPISEPYPYTDAKISLNTFDNPIQPVKVKVYNVGGGRLTVDRISIPHAHSRWVERKNRPKQINLEASSDPLEIELNVSLKDLPNSSSKNVAKLKLISKPLRKNFSDITLEVQSPEDQSAKLVVPEYINFGEITACKISINREIINQSSADFFLIGNFTHNPPTSIEITQTDENVFDAKIIISSGAWHYRLDLRNPGIVNPRLKPNSAEIRQQSVQRTFKISNVNRKSYSENVTTSDLDWLAFPTQINVAGYRTVNLSMSVKVDQLKQGKNFGELTISNKTIPVWAWFKTVNETMLTLNNNESDFHHIEELSEQERHLSLDIVSADQSIPTLMIFEDLDFHFPLAVEDQIGYLLGDFNNWTPRALFLEKHEDCFGATLSISEGTYLYRAELDGEMRLDPARLNEIVCCSHGIASKIHINRNEQKLTVRKKTKQKLNLKIQPSAEWMQIEPDQIVLIDSRKQEITVIFRPEYLQPGLNLGWIQFETTEEPTRSFHSPVYVMGRTNGAVPKRKNTDLIFPQIEQGQFEEIPFELDIIGKGELKGEVQPSTVLRLSEGDLHVRSETEYEPMAFTSALLVKSDKPTNAYRKQIRASLITDCYLANRRVLSFDAKYDMVHLVADPSGLYFPKIYLYDDPQTAEVVVRRSDGNHGVDCYVEIPEEFAHTEIITGWYSELTDRLGFALNPQAGIDAGRFSGSVLIKDKDSDMALPIQIVADIIGGKAKIDVDMQKQHLLITNIGDTELRIFDVQFKNNRFYLSSYLTPQQRTLLPDETIERQIVGKWRMNLSPKTKVQDTLIVKTNDPQFPNGVFEKEIATEIRWGFLNFRR